MKTFQKIILVVLLAGSLLGFFWMAQSRIVNEPLTRSRLMMGTIIEITVFDKNAESAITAAFTRIQQIEDVIGRNELSDMNRLAAQAGGPPLKVGPDTWQILSLAAEYWRKTDGAFDVTVNPLVELWGFGYDGEGNFPAPAAIKAALPKVGSDKLQLFSNTQQVRLAKPGMSLSMGGIAKGYAVEEAAKVLQAKGVKNAMINASSSIKVIGDGPGGRGWRVGVENPRQAGKLIGVIVLHSGEAMGTSADNKRFFIRDSHRYSHIIDPRTGQPAPETIALATVVTDNAATADIITKALFLNDLAWSMKFLKEENLRAVMVDATGKVHMTPGLRLLRQS
ncbi:MAG: Thiamine biosynthesis lipoprotein ApbE precursor [Syntrophus sp. PtaB.Bin001]|nr:MAG: Thiamine biosynthesis lipoprotein ApbE precursor [Syntrophus sp. PtaB.Bin001]